MVRLIFIVIAFLLLLGAFVGGLYFWGIDPLAKVNAIVGGAPAAEGSTPGVAAPSPPAFVDYGLLQVPVVQDHEVRKQAELILRLDVPSNKREVVAQNLPRLQNAFLQDMMEFLPVHLRGGRRLDPEVVRARLKQVADRTLGPGYVNSVIIQQASLK